MSGLWAGAADPNAKATGVQCTCLGAHLGRLVCSKAGASALESKKTENKGSREDCNLAEPLECKWNQYPMVVGWRRDRCYAEGLLLVTVELTADHCQHMLSSNEERRGLPKVALLFVGSCSAFSPLV